MEINNQPLRGARPGGRPDADDSIDFTRVNREGIQRATEEISELRGAREAGADKKVQKTSGKPDVAAPSRTTEKGSKGDRLEISQAAQQLARRESDGVESSARRQARVDELKQQHSSGTLNTHARAERAAGSMLTPP